MTGNLKVYILTVDEDAPVAGKEVPEVRLPGGSLNICTFGVDAIVSGDTR